MGVKYKILETLGTVNETEGTNYTIEVNKISWNGRPSTIDIRRWNRDPENTFMGKGVSLSDESVEKLVDILIQQGYGTTSILEEEFNKRTEE